jgi:TDG/mug DNA glycosylase family protein
VRKTTPGCQSGDSGSRISSRRCTPGIDTLEPEEYDAGLRALRRKVRRWRPEVVAFLGVTLFRRIYGRHRAAVALGSKPERFEGARVFVLPNPSGRNANYSYAEMCAAFKALRRDMLEAPDVGSGSTLASR